MAYYDGLGVSSVAGVLLVCLLAAVQLQTMHTED